MVNKALCGDIGGTNANFCIADYTNGLSLSEPMTIPTEDFDDFTKLIKSYLEHVKEKPACACIAVAGPVENQRAKMTNTQLIVDAREIAEKIQLEDVFLINDFDAVGYATNTLDPSEKLVINPGQPVEGAARIALGAGTGLGKSVLLYDQKANAYLPHSSEGGHADLPLRLPLEQIFAQGLDQSPTYEHFLSGRGIERLYKALQKDRYPTEPENLTAKEISEKRHVSPCCKETFQWFARFYARCAKNFALDILAKGGVFIAGGIAASNDDIFGEAFIEEFTKHPLPQYHEMLKNIPVTLIKNYSVSLRGAAYALKVFKAKAKNR